MQQECDERLFCLWRISMAIQTRVQSQTSTQVQRENDWSAGQVAEYADRLRAFCGVDPLKSYAISEIERCANNPYLHYGLKLHFGNSDVDMDNPSHVAQLRSVFRTADKHGMAIVVHMRSSVTRKRAYGAKEAKTFLD